MVNCNAYYFKTLILFSQRRIYIMHNIKLTHISKHISKRSKHTLENLISHPAGTEFIVLEETVSGTGGMRWCKLRTHIDLSISSKALMILIYLSP